MSFVDVILPLPLQELFTYRVQFEFENYIKKGQRIIVPFGKHRLYTALVKNIHNNPPKDYVAKYIVSILDSEPIINEKQFRFWDWISEYYMSYPGDIMNAALPSALKLASETKIILNPDKNIDYPSLNDREYLLVEALEVRNTLTLTDVSKILDIQKVFPIVKTLIEKEIIILEEEVKDSYKPKKDAYVTLTPDYKEDDRLSTLFGNLEKRAPKQLEILMTYISLTNRQKSSDFNPVREQSSYHNISVRELIKNSEGGREQLKSLVKKGVFEITFKQNSRLKTVEEGNGFMPVLNEYQQVALNQIKEHFLEKNVVLLHGVTSSGKTEIYIRMIEETIKAGKQVLYLLPEIALTTQIINRLQKYFGNKVGVYHSKFNDNERIEIWNRVLNNKLLNLNNDSISYQIILGARSTIFLPFDNLGLIIIDEEHDSSYKQYDPSPRYNARDAAIFLGKLHGAKVLLGSATPSIESYFNTEINKYGLVSLDKRYGEIEMPEIEVVDIKEDTYKNKMKSHFSPDLFENIKASLEKKEQVILFQNRRGFSPRIVCDNCNWTMLCRNCDVTLTYHKHAGTLKCHYCGYTASPPDKCPVCESTKLLMKGFGTEKIEEEMPIFFPHAKVARMDLDTTRTKYAFQQIINEFEEGNVDILIGTQMITKGLDFNNVTLVSILNADNMLSFPDFRAFERSFQLMSQVSGRAGRKNKRGKVIIQTFNPKHPVIKFVVENNYLSMYNNEIFQRQKFKYPPYYRLIELTLKCKESTILNKAANEFTKSLRAVFGNLVLGPEYPIVPKIRNEFLKSVMLKIEKNKSQTNVKKKLLEVTENFKRIKEFRSVKLVIDVDPY